MFWIDSLCFNCRELGHTSLVCPILDKNFHAFVENVISSATFFEKCWSILKYNYLSLYRSTFLIRKQFTLFKMSREFNLTNEITALRPSMIICNITIHKYACLSRNLIGNSFCTSVIQSREMLVQKKTMVRSLWRHIAF